MDNANQHQEHTGSYYAASAKQITDYPVQRGIEKTDICVVGAGFTGISTALTLAERGYAVTVLEANRVGWGASGRNGGQLIGGISGEHKIKHQHGGAYDDLLWEMRWRGNEIIRQRVEQYNIDCDLKSGYMEVALKKRQMGFLEDQYKAMEQHKFPHEFRMLDQDETRETLGTEAYIGGLVNMWDGHLHPLNLCLGEARAAADLGVNIFEHSPVLEIQHGESPIVKTEHGLVEASAVVLAGNAYHQLERQHLSGLTFPAGSYIIGTEPLPKETRRKINPHDWAICDVNEVVDYFRLSADGRMLFGGRCNYSGREPRSIEGALMPRMLRIYPELKDVRIDYQWGGHIGIVVKRIPVVGRINGNVYYAQGYSGHGVNVSHIFGEVIADAIGGTLERFDLFAGAKQFRIPFGQWFGNQAVALGMMYYKIRDLL